MTMPDDAVETRAQGWRTLAALHARIEDRLGRALEAGHDISVTEYTVLDVLGRQDEHHMRMQQLANAVALSQSATTRLVTRLEDRGLLARYLCPTDRRGIYTEVTAGGRALLDAARPTHDAALAASLADAAELPELAPLVLALARLIPAAA
jgi:DNA-binding MarR family transcriptional regulator